MKKKPVKASSLQENYYNDMISQQTFVSVYLKSSIRLKGFILFKDNSSVLLKNGDAVQMIYKNAISTICPELIFDNFETNKI